MRKSAVVPMCEALHYFETPTRRWAVALPFRLDAVIGGWTQLQAAMIRRMPEAFTRDEWAYLISFLDADNLLRPFHESFGMPSADSEKACHALARPRGAVAVWLPGNVSLLGPLTLILLSLTGNRLRLKASSHGTDLTAAFLDFARTNLPPGPLGDYLCQRVGLEQFDRHDARNAEYSREASCRIVFGSDEAAEAVAGLSHRAESSAFIFSDRRSEAWIEAAALDDAAVEVLIKVFAIYGQAGCTSPARVVLLDGAPEDARHLCDRILTAWPRIIRRQPPIHIASENVMARQWAAALGWEAVLAPQNAAVIATGPVELARPESLMFLPIVACPRDSAVKSLPANIQTIGHVVSNPSDSAWLQRLAATSVKRFVPVARMHHFGGTWDGWEFWRGMFEVMHIEARL